MNFLRLLLLAITLFGINVGAKAQTDDVALATALNREGLALYQEGRYAEAEPLYKRALTIREKALGPDHRDVAQSLNSLAGLYRVQGRYAEAEPLYNRTLAIREKALGPDHPDVATSLSNLSLLYRAQRRYAEGESLTDRALAIRQKAPGRDHLDLAHSLSIKASFLHDIPSRDEAERLYKRALAIYEKALGPDHREVAATLHNLAVLNERRFRFAAAEPLYKRALAIDEKALGPYHPNLALSLNNLADLHRSRGDFAAALTTSTRAVEIMERHLRGSAGQRSRGSAAERRKAQFYFRENIESIYAVAVNDPSFSNAPERSFRVAQLAQFSSAGEAVAGMAARFASGSDALAAVVRERQDLADRWKRLDQALVGAASQSPAERNEEEERRLRAELDETGKRLDALDSRISKDFPPYSELSNPEPLESGAVQRLLAPDEALLVYLIDPSKFWIKKSWLWVLRGNKTELHRIDINAEDLQGEVQALRQALDPAFNPRLKPFPATRAYELHQKILAPASSLLAGARHVFIVPDAALQSLPIGVLVTKPPEADPDDPEDHRTVAWFAREHAVTVLPSVSSLRALREFSNAARASKPFLGIGDPTLEGKPGRVRGTELASLFRGAVADVDAVRKLDPLPETADELRAVAKSRGATEADLLLADRATEPQIRATELTGYQVVHFATHGLVVGEMKGLSEPALVLTPPVQATPENDGLLTASKVATLKLNADWVVLSACNTAAGDGSPGAGGLSGLAKAFFYAGARSLLVSHWSVPSEATVKLVTGAFDALGKEPGIGRAESLRRSQMAMLDPSAKPELAHPLFWAPFVLAGEGGAGR